MLHLKTQSTSRSPGAFPRARRGLILSQAQYARKRSGRCLPHAALSRRLDGLLRLNWLKCSKLRQRLQRDDPRVSRNRYRDVFGCPRFHEQVCGDEKRKRECRHQRGTCELVTNAHLSHSGFVEIPTREALRSSINREKVAERQRGRWPRSASNSPSAACSSCTLNGLCRTRERSLVTERIAAVSE